MNSKQLMELLASICEKEASVCLESSDDSRNDPDTRKCFAVNAAVLYSLAGRLRESTKPPKKEGE